MGKVNDYGFEQWKDNLYQFPMGKVKWYDQWMLIQEDYLYQFPMGKVKLRN